MKDEPNRSIYNIPLMEWFFRLDKGVDFNDKIKATHYFQTGTHF